MNKVIKSLKKVLGSILIISLLINLCNITMAENIVNTDGGEGETGDSSGLGTSRSNVIEYITKKGARVSLWDIETQTLIDSKDMLTFSSDADFEKFCEYKLLSIYTKPE